MCEGLGGLFLASDFLKAHLIKVRGGTNCPVFANCSVFCDVREVRSSVLGKKVMFGGVRSSVLMFGELSEHLG